MAIKYAQFTVSIHGLNADADALDFLNGWVRGAVRAGLLGNQRDRFNFRDEYENDVEVEIVETAES